MLVEMNFQSIQKFFEFAILSSETNQSSMCLLHTSRKIPTYAENSHFSLLTT